MLLQLRKFYKILRFDNTFLFVLIISNFNINVVNSQPYQFLFNTLTTRQGLSASDNAFIYKDSKGLVWISSTDGLNRYDGCDVKIYRPGINIKNGMLGENIQSRFVEDKETNLWFSTWDGINYYRRQSDDFLSYRLKDKSGKWITEGYHVLDWNEKYRFLLVQTSDSDLTNSGTLYRFYPDNGVQEMVMPLSGIRFEKFDAGSIKYFASYHLTESSGLNIAALNEQSENTGFFTFCDGDKPGEPKVHVYGVYFESDIHLWVASDKGLIKLNVNDRHYEIYPLKGNHKPYNVIGIGNKKLICSSRTGGLFIFDKELKTFIDQVVPDAKYPAGLKHDRNDELYLDADSVLWVSQWTHGVQFAYLNQRKFENMHIEDYCSFHKEAYITGMVQGGDDKIYVINSQSQLFQCDIKNKTVTEIHHKIKRLRKIIREDNRILLLSADNVYYLKGNKMVQLYRNAIFSDALHLIKYDNKSRLISTKTGIYILDSVGIHKFKSLKEVQIADFICKDSLGNLFINNNFSELKLLTPNGKMLTHENIGLISGVDFSYDGKIAWLATSKGLVRYNTETHTMFIYDESHYLPNQYIHSVFVSDNTSIWLTTNKGIVNFNPLTEKYRLYGLMDGLTGDEFYMHTSCKLRDGSFCFGSGSALNIYDLKETFAKNYAPKIVIEGIRFNDSNQYNILNILTDQSYEIPSESNTLTFDFAALHYNNPEENILRYKLSGYDKDWLYLRKGEKGKARYANFPSEEYSFSVDATGSDGIWTNEPFTFTINVLPKWYNELWFRLLISIVFISVIYYIWKQKTEKLLALQKIEIEKHNALFLERNRMSKDMHDELGSGISALQLISNLIHTKPGDTHISEIEKELSLLDSNAQRINTTIREMIWSIDNDTNTIMAVMEKIKPYAYELTQSTQIKINYDLDPIILSQPIDNFVKKNIYMCLKECLNNIVKHSGATHTMISVQNENQHLVILVSDNGKGMPPENIHQGYGLKNMMSRMEQSGGNIEIISQNGTTIKMTIPLAV